jgi:hypothetical protein
MTAVSVNAQRLVPTVYVVQEDPKKNLTPALEFGNLEALLDRDDEMTMLNATRVVRKLRHGLRNYQPTDLIIPIGNPIAIGIAFAIAAEKTGGEFCVLKWDQQEATYYQVKVNLHPDE